MVVQKGKQATKGQKQIVDENKSTLNFYTLMSCGAMGIYLLAMFSLFIQHFSLLYWFLTIFAGGVYLACLSVMKYMAKAIYSPTGTVIDGGTDLNMENGFAENLKDLIILTSGIQVFSLVSNYFWILWLFAPGRAFYLLWVNILGPWFFQPEQPQEVDEKKQKKLERKMKRIH